MFQSTRPRGARLNQKLIDKTENGFNPRARVGRDKGWRRMMPENVSFNPRARVGRDLQKMG